MIRANELRIGNYYQEKGVFYQVDAIDIVNLVRCERNNIKSDMEFIPLSEDILLKAGGKKNEHITIELTNERKLLFTTNHTTYYQVFLLQDDDMIALSMDEISVHQLQNLYFALTGKELDIKL